MIRPNQKARSIIKRNEYAILATVDTQGLPWNAPVYFAYDKYYNLYWGSHKDSQHAQNVMANGRIFVCIFNSTMPPGSGEGVYIQGRCTELADAEQIALARRLIQDRRNPIPYWKLEQFQVDGPIKLYQVTPEKIWLNGDSRVNGTYIDVRIDAGE
jgi:nitroimidazol reductase NimA-like FMN-containing flavoprotein (pyridoxamine 5'-phosphate oxidase superfamily)